MNYEESTDYLYSLQRMQTTMKLEPLKRALTELGSPELTPSVQIAGTNGKGSVAVLMSNALSSAGGRVGLFISPHLEEFEERITVNGERISKEDVARYITLLRPSIKKHSLTFFEAVTAMAFLYFKDKNTDINILEVGLGGRLDATTVASPKLAVITTIGLDHTHILGTTLKKISTEKAGIIKPGCIVVSGVDSPVIKHTAKEKNAEFILAPEKKFDLSLGGEFQQHNASVAYEALRHLGVDDATIRSSFKTTKWPGRFERFDNVLLDCAHNPQAIAALLTSVNKLSFDKLIVVTGMKVDKDSENVAKQLSAIADTVIVTQFSAPPDPLPVTKYAKMFSAKTVLVHSSPEKAIALARALASDKDLILVTGSLFLIGQVRRLFKVVARV